MLLKLQNVFIFAALIAISNCLTIVRAEAAIVPTEQFSGGAAASYVVNTLDNVKDGVCNATHCSLRDAISEANADGMDSTITFGVSGIIQLDGADNTTGGSNGLPVITTPITINGGGQITVRRNTGGDYRIFRVGGGGNLTLDDIIITNGRAAGSFPSERGGGIYNDGGTLTLQNGAEVRGNSTSNVGGGIVNTDTSTLTLNGAIITGNTTDTNGSGGGVFTFGTVYIRDSLIGGPNAADRNTANFGGGISATSGTVNIINSTFQNNRSRQSGGALEISGATLNMLNTTVSGNNANNLPSPGGGSGGGMIVNGSNSVFITNSTFVGNQSSQSGAQIFTTNGAQPVLKNSIFQGGDGCQGSYNAASANNVGPNCPDNEGKTSVTGLGSLASNGGATQTHALSSGSVEARGAASDCNYVSTPADNAFFNGILGIAAPSRQITTDQRGEARPAFNCDIGSFQLPDATQTGATLIVTTLDNVVNGDCTVAHCSLREAINAANNLAGANTINFGVSGTIELAAADNGGNNGLPIITTPIVINGDKDGDGDSDITIARSSAAGTPNFRIIQVQTDSSLELNYLTISNGNFNGNGAGIFNDASLTINNSTISNNQAAQGGGIFSDAGMVSINNSTIAGNTANGSNAGLGGGIYTEFAALTIINSTISGNRSDNNGGGLYVSDSTVNISFTTFTDNTADSNNNGSGSGGGFFTASGALTIRNSLITGNSDTGGLSGDCGGAVTWSGSNLVGDNGNARGCDGASNTLAYASSNALNATLANNGSSTLTHALVFNSPAQQLVPSGQCGVIGSETVTLAVDQRGAARPQFSLCDVGAVESTVLMPTAASVSISGRVLASNGRGISNAVVTLTTQSGENRTTRTNPFGYYRFNDLAAGQTVTVSGVSKRFQFAPQIINLNEDLNSLNFVAAP